jgi:hypothetical protein
MTLTVQDDMGRIGSDTQSADIQRPFKIFLSLLDRWEVGAVLSERLAIPALDAIRAGLPGVAPEMRGEVRRLSTAVTDVRCSIRRQQYTKPSNRS